MKNISEVRTQLIETLIEFKEGGRKPAEMAEISNAVGKIVSTLKIELEYSALRKEKPIVPFLKYEKSK